MARLSSRLDLRRISATILSLSKRQLSATTNWWGSYGPLRANSVARLRTSGAVLHGHRVVSLGAVNLREMVDSVLVWYHEFEFAPASSPRV